MAFCAVSTLTRFSSSSARSSRRAVSSLDFLTSFAGADSGAGATEEARLAAAEARDAASVADFASATSRSRSSSHRASRSFIFASSSCARLSFAARTDASAPRDARAAVFSEVFSAPRMATSAAFCIASTSLRSSSLIASLSCASRLSFCASWVLRRETSVSSTRLGPRATSRRASAATRCISPARCSASSARRASVTSCLARCCSYFIVSASIACSRSFSSATS